MKRKFFFHKCACVTVHLFCFQKDGHFSQHLNFCCDLFTNVTLLPGTKENNRNSLSFFLSLPRSDNDTIGWNYVPKDFYTVMHLFQEVNARLGTTLPPPASLAFLSQKKIIKTHYDNSINCCLFYLFRKTQKEVHISIFAHSR